MAKTVFVRRNAAVLPWLRALAFGAATYLATAAFGFYPVAVPAVLAIAMAVLALVAPGIGVLVFVVAAGIPLAAGDIVVGALFMLLGFSTIQYLSDSHGRNFLVICLAFIATAIRAEWAVVALAGLLLGSGEGAIVSLLACLALELAGLFTGHAAVGILATGGSRATMAVDLAKIAALRDPLSFGWVADGLARVTPATFVKAFTSLRDPVLFVAQPLSWAAGAAVAGILRRPPADPRRGPRALIAAAAGVAVLATAGVAGSLLLGGPVKATTLVIAAAVSIALALATAAASEWVFTLTPEATPVERGAEDADVDELLRMISSAEEELASKHTVRRTVLITDMKSFSRITEELGSTETARLVQRHRDLLLPLIDKWGGHGKSTGGDGLLAAFEQPSSALGAAVEMQRALADYNAKRPGEEAILIRAGIASGEVVLDKGGKPFLGDALNRAARVMSLADGGQVFTTQEDLEQAQGSPFRSVAHGGFRLKNIAQPVRIVEILWADDQEAHAPHEALEGP